VSGAVGNWDALSDEVVGLASALIRFDTTNPPGNETPCLEWIQQQLAVDGIDSDIIESAPGRGNLLARLTATDAPEGEPLMLAAHVDVVAAPDLEQWTHPPFAGVVSDGFLWGRGALDMKGPAATYLTIFRALHRWNVPLKRDIVLMLNADEETGGSLGAVWTLEHHLDRVNAGASLSEGGGMGVEIGDRRYFLVGVDEKRSYRFTMTAHGRSGHAAVPHDDSAIVHLARAIAAIADARPRAQISDTFRRCVTAIADTQPEPVQSGLRGALHPDTVDEALDRFLPHPFRERLRAMVRATYVPTMMQAGVKDNLMPDRAYATVNCRTLPEDDAASIQRHLREVLTAAGVADKVTFEFPPMPSFPPVPLDHPLLDALVSSLARNAPDHVLVPMVAIAGSDNRHLRAKGIDAYGFYPMPPEVDPRLFHNVDERISLEQLAFGTRVLGDAVLTYCRRA